MRTLPSRNSRPAGAVCKERGWREVKLLGHPPRSIAWLTSTFLTGSGCGCDRSTVPLLR